ncbi:Ribosomal protein L34 [Apiospora hydei]|uniref:Ribosomal protein L34 n=1 Tax=Apiospora hydei TaxID=1337664 RepID=A0ABR1V8U2_9PEZI
MATPCVRAALARLGSQATKSSQPQSHLSRRTFTSLPSLRPSLPSARQTIFRASQPTCAPVPTAAAPCASTGESVLDIVPKTAISSSPIFGGVQIRCGPRPTMATSSRLIRKRRHGFLSRIRSRNGRRTLQRRKSKSRHVLSM